MFKIFRYTFYDLFRSRWTAVYLVFYLVLGFVLLFINNDLSKGIITMLNILLMLVPLISTIFGVMYYYSSQEFTELLLAQPIKRSTIFLGQYAGLSTSLVTSLVVGLGVPFLSYGLFRSSAIGDFVLLIVVGAILTFIFSAIAYNIALLNNNRIKGFGIAILIWLLFAVIYDGVFLLCLLAFDDYPLDKFSLFATMFNPIDLSRILILLKLDVSALLGYTGAVFQKFFKDGLGMGVALVILCVWMVLPLLGISRVSKRKDF